MWVTFVSSLAQGAVGKGGTGTPRACVLLCNHRKWCGLTPLKMTMKRFLCVSETVLPNTEGLPGGGHVTLFSKTFY